MKELAIDIETYSSHDLKSCGVYRYVEADDFTILLFSYSVDGGAVQCVDFARGLIQFHDEIVVEAKPGQTLQDVENIFSKPIDWCRDLPLKGAGYSTPYYLKD